MTVHTATGMCHTEITKMGTITSDYTCSGKMYSVVKVICTRWFKYDRD